MASAEDPVARGMLERWGELPSTGIAVDGEELRVLAPQVGVLRRRVRHIHDEHLDRRWPDDLGYGPVPFVFPSIHWSERGPACFTVHPLGNPGPNAEVGGEPGRLCPSAPRLMASALRALARAGPSCGLPATYEATHHGPALEVPAFFVEVGGGPDPEHPSSEVLDVLAEVIPRLEADPADRIALAVGGGHYAPHFTELALTRRWAFGHILPRHSLEALSGPVARAAWDGTRGAEGIVFARAADSGHPALLGLGPRLRDQDAPRRPPEAGGAPPSLP